MGWYDHFSHVYDLSLEARHRPTRALATEALDVRPDSVVLDLPCGTGQAFPGIVERLGPDGALIGVDLSDGMLRKARARVARAGWTNVAVHPGDATKLTAADLLDARGDVRRPDRLHVYLGATVFPDLDATFARLWDLLAPGGRCVVVDVYAARLGLEARLVRCIARADTTRRAWEPLARLSEGFERRDLPTLPGEGGTLWLATGTKPLA